MSKDIENAGEVWVLNTDDAPKISIVVPVFQEEETIPRFLERMVPVVEGIGSYEIIFCVDPGNDDTIPVIESAIAENPNIAMLVFSRRFGQPSATIAGILNCRGETCAIIDVDLQDPPELIGEMYHQLDDGFEVVYAVRRSRKGETWIKRLVSYLGYKLINAISDVNIPRNAGDFRIITRRIVEEVRMLHETHGFLRGIIAFVGYRQGEILYDRDERSTGTSKYSQITGSLKIGFNGIIAYSNRLLFTALVFGFVIAGLSFFLAVIMVGLKIFSGVDYPMGIPTITVLVLFLGGVQLISIGIIGEYIGRIYDEVKRRPMYLIEKSVNLGNDVRHPLKSDGTRERYID